MTNNKEETIHWEESTKHRDELKNKEQSLIEKDQQIKHLIQLQGKGKKKKKVK